MAWTPLLVGFGSLASLVALTAIKRSIRIETVFEYEQGYRFRRGRLRGRLGPGRYWLFGTYSSIVKVDLRSATVTVPGQEVLSQDGVAIKCSLAVRYEIVDGERALLKHQDHHAAFYLELQVALRQAVATLPIESLLQAREELNQRIHAAAIARAEDLGIKLVEVAIKDLALPGDLKKIFAQTVKARQEGHAALERSRGETAALRSLANAALMLEKNPMLLQLRALQSMADAPHSSFVFGAGATPLPAGAADGRNGHGGAAPAVPGAPS